MGITEPNIQRSLPFFIDWDRLSPPEVENLCQELLAQMGFLRLEWAKTPEIDLVAEFPKKDLDGLEYRELWLVSLGLREPIDRVIRMVDDAPDYFIHRLLRYSDRFGEMLSKQSSITFLFILFRTTSNAEKIEVLKERVERQRRKESLFKSNIRLRIWDQDYLTSLVHRFPLISYKYFSDEGRIRSETRKSYEELYRKNINITASIAQVNTELREEKDKRIRAERDAIWKDISFAAAHKIGNPIFAIETYLGPLQI